MNDKLLPCPFCGSVAMADNGFSHAESITYAYCANNKCHLHLIDVGFTPDEWNKRAQPAAPAPAGWVPVTERYTCIGKGGSYELIGRADCAGTLRHTWRFTDEVIVYRDVESGNLYYRAPGDFMVRMELLPAEREHLRAELSTARELVEALNFAAMSLAQITSSDGSGHADIALCVLRMAGVPAEKREALVEGWKAKAQWRIDAALAKLEGTTLLTHSNKDPK